MTVLIDYRCSVCGSTNEAYVETPAPARRECEQCGGESRRRWSPVGMISNRTDAPRPVRRTRPSAQSLCSQNPDVPGLCHMSPSAGRAWVARYRGDGRALDAELARQQVAATEKKPTIGDAISHSHTHEGHQH